LARKQHPGALDKAVRNVRGRPSSLRGAAVAVAAGLLLSVAVGAPARADETSTASATPTGSTTSADPSTGSSTTSSSGSTTTSDSPSGSPTGASDTPTPTPTPTATDSAGSTPTGTPTDPTGTPDPTSTSTPPSATATPVPPIVRPHPTPSSAAHHNPAVPDPGDGESALTPAQLAAQLAQAQALQSQLHASNARLAAIQARLAALSAQSSAALQALEAAQQAEQQALATQSMQTQRLADLQARADTLRVQLARWARAAYVAGGTLARYQAYLAALQATRTDEIGNNLFLINYIGQGEDQAIQEADTLTQVQRIVSQQADAAAAQATSARVAAEQANTAAEAAVAQQQALLTAEESAQAGRLGLAGLSLQQLANLHNAQAIAARTELAAAAAGVSTAGASCRPGVTKATALGYGNGQIPTSALCPLWGAPGQLLRADAAAAFDRLSRAYARQFSRPICVTDSYRSFSQQVALYAAKPNLAARPGTSNHGWGVAVDLCGGVESFGTVEHTWLFTHAPLYGWFHPSWAEPTGSRPEPWHWEFAS
jgi:zinc D-Ala-D-Ala carboxypeptidase